MGRTSIMSGFNFNNVGFVGNASCKTIAPIVTRPIPIIYRASSLASSTTIAGWQNQGATGSLHDLKLRYTGQNPTYQAVTSTTPASIRMTDVSFESLGLLPDSFSGHANRTVGICSMLEAEDYLNLLGYGTTADYKLLFDVLTFGGSYLFPHYFGNQIYINPRNQVGVFQIVIVRSTASDGNPTVVDFFSSNGFVNTQLCTNFLNTAPGTPLFIGSGAYLGYNKSTARQISGVFMADYAMTNIEIQAAMPLLTS